MSPRGATVLAWALYAAWLAGCAFGPLPAPTAAEAGAPGDGAESEAGSGDNDDANACGAALTPCNGVCVDTSTDTRNCGGCGLSCTPPAGAAASCVAGACAFTCVERFASCGTPGAACQPVGTDEACGDCQSATACNVAAGFACVRDTAVGRYRCCRPVTDCAGGCGTGEVCVAGGDGRAECCAP